MSRYSVSPELLFDRPWRPGHPFRPHCGRFRRWCMIVLLTLFCLIIGGYDYLTDSARVRAMAQSYLSRLIGGRVEVGGARLSIFEGLRLENVNVHVDDAAGASDSVIFSAQSFVIRYDPRSMLAGQLEATQIVVEKPRVLLAENMLDGSWNYHRLAGNRSRRAHPLSVSRGPAQQLPEIVLRNARLDMSELRGGKLISRGYMAIDGLIAPSPDADHYSFELQSRGVEGIGPFVSGTVNYGSGAVDAHLRNFQFGDQSDFGHDVMAMLPAAVRNWWQRHELSGRLDIPVLHYVPPRDGKPASFRVETDLNGVTMTVGPEEWGGSGRKTAATQPAGPTTPPEKPNVLLRQVAGVLIFTEDGIEVTGIDGRIENNAFRVTGRIDGYQPASPVQLRLSSLDSENIYIPAAPRYVASLPPAVREVYENLKPQGTCGIDIQLERLTAGAKPVVRGQIDVIDGQFVFAKFPYPLREATGRIVFGPDRGNDDLVVKLIGLKGRGVANGPNADSWVKIDGAVGPFARGGDPITDLQVSGLHVSSEPALRDAFPPEVKRALKLLGARGGSGDGFPSFHGNFFCRVSHPSPRARFTFDTDLTLDDAAGALDGFPYPLEHVRGDLKVRDGYVDILGIKANHGTAAVVLNGRVAWPADDPALAPQPLQTSVRLSVKGMPIDDDLLGALPADRRAWLTQMKVSGNVDVEGTVSLPPIDPGVAPPARTAESVARALNYDLQVSVHDGSLQPAKSAFAIGAMEGGIHFTPERMHLDSLSGTRGAGKITATGDITWPHDRPELALVVSAKNLELDQPLHDLLPPDARSGWDSLQPVGSVNARITYRSQKTPAPETQAAQASLAPGVSSELIGRPTQEPADVVAEITPATLRITPRDLPYAFDALGGMLTVRGDHLILTDLSARHGDSTFALDGTGELGQRPVYELRVGARKVMVDEALVRSLPASIGGILEALKLHGLCDIRFPRLTYRLLDGRPEDSPGTDSLSAPPVAEVDLTTTISLHDATLDVGVPLDHVNGDMSLDASIYGAHLKSIHGKIGLASLAMAGRQLRDFKANLVHVPERSELQISKMRADLAGGELAGDVRLTFPDDGPSRYALQLVARNVDVRTLANEADDSIKGDLTASLALEGAWGDPASRRGRGDVLVAGKEMYRIPLVLGLLQVTNLALPIAQPFQHGAVRYSLDGQRVNFDQIELRSNTMIMSGSGHLDFATRQVRMSFTTDNPGGLNVPFLRDLWQGARNELLKINVKGTITQPKVETSVMGTFTTTVDEVLRGDDKK